MTMEIRNKVRDFLIIVNRLDNIAVLEGAEGISVLNWITLMTDLARQAQYELVAIHKDLADAEAVELDRQSIATAETACGDTDREYLPDIEPPVPEPEEESKAA